MTRIRINNLLNPTDRKIKNWNSDFIISDGPHETATLSLSDLNAHYNSYYGY